MKRLTTTLLLTALLLSLAAAVWAWDGDDECPAVKTYQCADPCAPCPDCAPILSCPEAPPPAGSPCDRLRALCPDRYHQWTVVDPAGTWLKCRARGCVLSEAVP